MCGMVYIEDICGIVCVYVLMCMICIAGFTLHYTIKNSEINIHSLWSFFGEMLEYNNMFAAV